MGEFVRKKQDVVGGKRLSVSCKEKKVSGSRVQVEMQTSI
jgi:hypothetical protein